MPNILIVAPNWIGDAVMSEPLIRALQNPQTTVSVLATPWVAPVYRAILGVERVIEMDFSHGKLQFKKRKETAKMLMSYGFTDAIILPNSWKSVIIPTLAKIPKIYGYAGELRSFLLTKFLSNPPRNKRPPMVEHYLQLATLLNIQFDRLSAELRRPVLNIQSSEQHLSLFQKLNLQVPFIVFAPGAEYGPAKQWPASHFAELANHILQNDLKTHIVLIGSKKDHEISNQIIHQVETKYQKRILNFCGMTNLDDSIVILTKAKGLVSNDSGIMHIGAAFTVPQIAFFGSSDPTHTPPLSPSASIMYLGLDCSPCHKRKCPLGHLNCLNEITPQSAFEEINRVIESEKA
jgi:heptosyltransferase-2